MAVQIINTVELTEDNATDTVVVEPLREGESGVTSHQWAVRLRESNTNALYVSNSDLRAFAEGLLALVDGDA